MAKRFSACEIIEIGIQIEENGRDFYKSLAAVARGTKAEKVLLGLASAEEDHIKVFREVFTGSCAYDPEGAYPEEYFSYMNSLASEYVFTRKGAGEKAASGLTTYEQGLDLGISFEKDSILFYEEMKKFVAASERRKIDILIENEKKHLSQLVQMKEDAKK